MPRAWPRRSHQLGRPSTLSEKQKQVSEDLAAGTSILAIARKFATSRQTTMRVRDEGSRAVRP
nr:helix-turn-helix domain-containing protein [Falsochrobactrum shanghaiense]